MGNKVRDIFTAGTVFPSGATNSSTFTNSNARGVKFVIDITAFSGTSPTLTVKLQAKGRGGGTTYVDVAGAATAAITGAVGLTELTVYPGIAETTNVSVSDVLPALYRVVATVGGSATPTITATITGHEIE